MRETNGRRLFIKAQPHFTTKGGAVFYKQLPFEIQGKGTCTAPVDDGLAVS